VVEAMRDILSWSSWRRRRYRPRHRLHHQGRWRRRLCVGPRLLLFWIIERWPKDGDARFGV
jgi:hypothetical protein